MSFQSFSTDERTPDEIRRSMLGVSRGTAVANYDEPICSSEDYDACIDDVSLYATLIYFTSAIFITYVMCVVICERVLPKGRLSL